MPAKCEIQRQSEFLHKPIIIHKDEIVLDFSPEVKGVISGMVLQKALSQCRDTILVRADEAYYHEVFAKVLDALMRKSPIVEAGELGCAFIGLGGLGTMYKGHNNLISLLLDTVPPAFNPRIGVANAKFPAYVAATRSMEGRALRVPEDISMFLENISVDILPMSWTNRRRLHGFGLHTMGQVASQSVGAMQAQFGVDGKIAWELSRGVDESLITPIRLPEEVKESLTFPVPTANLFIIVSAMEVLLGRAFDNSSVRGRYFRKVSIEANIVNRTPWTKQVVFKSPVDSKEKSIFVLKNTLERVKFSGPLEDLTLILTGSTGQAGIQASFFKDVRKKEQLREMMEHLQVKLCKSPPVYKIMEMEPWSRIPERRHALVQFVF